MDNLDTLATSLPTAYQNAEKELLSDFKAAALSITTLYRSSRTASKRAYNAGYSAAYKDLLMMIQQGVSAGGITTSESQQGGMDDGMTIGRVMDWIEARLEAIRSREEEEDEDEEREKERDHVRPSKAPQTLPTPTTTPRPVNQAAQSRPQTFSAAPDNSDISTVVSSPTTLRTISHPQPPSKGFRNRAKDKESSDPPTSERNPSPAISGINHIFPDQIPTAGSKRRHAVMVMLDSTPSVANSASTLAPPGGNHSTIATRRRTRSARNLTLHHNQNIMQPPEAMDVEEDGRDRKRVTRR